MTSRTTRRIADFFAGRGGYWFWVAVFFLVVGGGAAALFFATKRVDYIWRWNRVPEYFAYKEKVDVTAEEAGNVTFITRDGGRTLVTVTGETGERTYELPSEDLATEQGAHLYSGDRIGGHTEWRTGLLVEGLWLTLKISFLSIIFGIIIGLVTGLARLSKNPAFKWLAILYIELIRGSPLIVQIFIWYFALGTVINGLLQQYGVEPLSPVFYGMVAMATFAGAYIAEIVRAGIQSIHRGQMEAARSLGMTYPQSMRHVILPQALKRIIPPLAGQFISHIKDSSLLGVIAIRELSKATREAVTSSFQVFEFYLVCALLYLVITFSLSMITQWVERRMVYD